ncbi:hypothetical protein H072_3848 [Dactylellina haptotyla CBS 200.50]|uniref:Inner kinetochore subunit AME1 domain-containing protein n=1 Tax=Dactylellina haptotyla (strain CBS 200.50) TaxID=1284197 RepID=S8AGT0_DACHA|nr:hypothetical protein H072_3848 [Dactylellina haptotyla CBS 200.50]
MSELTRQRHEERMAERRRGAGNRVVTQTFGFDLPLITATPPAARAQKVAEKAEAAKSVVEEPIGVPGPTLEEPQRRRSGRLSRGASVLSAASAQDVAAEIEGSSRKRPRLESGSPRRSVSARRSTSAVTEAHPEIIPSGVPTPVIVTTEAPAVPIAVDEVQRTPAARTTPRVSSRRVSLAPEASVMLSSPSPLPPRSSRHEVPSSVSPEPLPFIPDPPPPEEVAITPERVASVSSAEPTPRTPATATSGLRGTRGRRSKPAIAALTPVPRGKRRRQPSPDKFLTPEKPPTPESEEHEEEELEADVTTEQIAPEERVDTPPADEVPEADSTIVEQVIEKPLPKRRGRKPKTKKPSVEIPFQELPITEEAVLSDVEPEMQEDNEESLRLVPVEEEQDYVDVEEDDLEEVAEEEEQEKEQLPEESVLQPKSSKGATNPTRRGRQPGKSKRRNENGEPKETFDITVYRIPKQGDFDFKFPKQPNNIQIVSEFLMGIIDKQLETLSLRKGSEKDREEKARMKLREAVVKNLSSELENRFIEMANKADNIKMKTVQLKRLQKEKLQLRDELMQLRESREDIARQMDVVRKKHEEASEKAHKQQYINDTLKHIGLMMDQGRAKAAAVPPEERALTTVGLDALLNSVTEDLCTQADGSSGGGKGILEQVKEMNRFLEAATEALRQGQQ